MNGVVINTLRNGKDVISIDYKVFNNGKVEKLAIDPQNFKT